MNNSNEFVYKLPGTILDIIKEDTYQKIMPFVNIINDGSDEGMLKIENTFAILKELGHYIYRKIIKISKEYNNNLYYDVLSYVAKATIQPNYDITKDDELKVLKTIGVLLQNRKFTNTAVNGRKIFDKYKFMKENGFNIDTVISIFNDLEFQKLTENTRFPQEIWSMIRFLELKPNFNSPLITGIYKVVFNGTVVLIRKGFLNSDEQSPEWRDRFRKIIRLVDDYERMFDRFGERNKSLNETQHKVF